MFSAFGVGLSWQLTGSPLLVCGLCRSSESLNSWKLRSQRAARCSGCPEWFAVGGSVTSPHQKPCSASPAHNSQGPEMIQQTGSCKCLSAKALLGKMTGSDSGVLWKRGSVGNVEEEEEEAPWKWGRLFSQGGAWQPSLDVFNDLMMILLQFFFPWLWWEWFFYRKVSWFFS